MTDADRKSALDVARELGERSRAAKDGRDGELAKSKDTTNALPLPVLRVGLRAADDRPVAVDGRVEVRPILPVTATIDHRFVDGWHIARAMKTFRGYLDSPANFEPQI